MKRILSFLLTVAICLSVMVIPASATETTMPEVTDFSGYELKTDVDSLNISSYGINFRDLDIKGDYVIKLTYKQGAAISSDSGHLYAGFFAGGNAFLVAPVGKKVRESSWNGTVYNPTNAASGSWSDQSAVRTKTGNTESLAWTTADSTLDVSAWYSNDNTTKYDVYISKIDGEMTFGIKNNTATEYDWFNTTYVSTLEENDFLIRNFTSGGLSVENLKIYTEKIPMSEVTDFSGYELKKDVSSVSVGSYGINFSNLDMNGDYVIKLTYKQGAAISSDSGHLYAGFFAGGNAFLVAPVGKKVRESSWNGTVYNPTNAASGSWSDQSAVRTKTGNTESLAWTTADSTLDVSAWYSNDNTTKYDVYISKVDGVMTFGIKNNTATDYDWFNTTYVSTLEENDFLIRNFTSGGLSVENLKVYTEPEIITDIAYTEGTGTVAVGLDVTRNSVNVSDTAVLITAVYVTKAGVKQMVAIVGTEEKTLELGTGVFFSNTVTVPAAGADETISVVSYLCDSYNGFVPITGAFVME